MLKSLNVLPKEVREDILKLVNRPECVKVMDMAGFTEETGLTGGLYIVFKNDVKLWEEPYRTVTSHIMSWLAERWPDVWDISRGVNCADEEYPLDLLCVEDYVEGVDYRVLTKEEAIREVA